MKATPNLHRSAILSGVLETAGDLGVDAVKAAAEVGLPADALSSPDLWITTSSAARLLKLVVQRSGAEDFGLKLATKRRLSNLGKLALLAKNQATIGQAVIVIGENFELQGHALRKSVVQRGDVTELRFWIADDDLSGAIQNADMMVGAALRAIEELAGEPCAPLSVHFARSRPKSISAYQTFFKCQVLFDQPFDGMIYTTADLARPIPGADPELARLAAQFVAANLRRDAHSWTRSITTLIGSTLATGICTADTMALMLDCNRRTMHRCLLAEGARFDALLNLVRLSRATDLVEGTRRPFSEVSALLGFSDQSAFCNWYKAQHQQAPSARRRQVQDDVSAYPYSTLIRAAA